MVLSFLGSWSPVGVVFVLATNVAKVSCSAQPIVVNPSEVWYADLVLGHVHNLTDIP